MKIIYLHQYFNTPLMSGGTRSYEMARRMVAAGHEVHMVTSYRDDDTYKRKGWFSTEEAGIKVHWYPVPYTNQMSYRKRIRAFFAFALASRRQAKLLGGDIVFATSTPLTIAWPAVMASRRNGIPMVFEVRDLWPEAPILMGVLKNPLVKLVAKLLERWAYKNSDAIVALAPRFKKAISEMGYPITHIAVVPNGCDNSELKSDSELANKFLASRPHLKNSPLLVYAGTLGRVNNVGFLVKVASALKDMKSNIKILIVGDGVERDQVVCRAKDLGVLNHNFFVEPYLPKREVVRLLSAATMTSNLVLDIPQLTPDSGNKFFDSLAASKPVLINHGGLLHDLVNEYECGLSVWQLSIEDAAQKINEKMHDTRWLEEAGIRARTLAEREFDRDMLAGKLIKVLEGVVCDNAGLASSIASGDYIRS